MSKGLKTFSSAIAASLAVVAACSPIAAADTTTPTWNCRASVIYATQTLLNFPPINRIDPLAANGSADPQHVDNDVCADDSKAVETLNPLPASSPIQVRTDEVAAATVLSPQTGPARDQTASASTSAAHVTLNLGNGALIVEVEGVRSQATADCFGTTPRLTGSSQIVKVSINGQELPIDDALKQLADGLAPLYQLIKLVPNEQVVTGDANTDTQSLSQTALRLELLNPTGQNPAIVVALGESKVTRQGRTCDGTDVTGAPLPAQTTPNTPGGNNPGPSGPTTPSVVFVPVQVPTNTGSSTNSTAKVQVNGTNGGCGTVRMFFDKNRQKTFNSRFGTRVVTRGRLISCSGKPIIGGRVDVFHQIRGHSKRLRKTGIRSRGGGLVTLILPLNITSRKIFFEYRGNLASAHVNSRSTLTITVRDKNGKILTKLPPGQPKPHF